MESLSNNSVASIHWDGYTGAQQTNFTAAGTRLPQWGQANGHLVREVFMFMCLICGVIFNTFILLAIITNRKLRSVRNILLAHLAMLNLVSSCTVVCVSFISLLRRVWLGGLAVCQVYGYVFSLIYLVSVWTITALSWDKYQTIANPLHHSQNASFRKMALVFAIFWFSGLIFALPPLAGGNSFFFHPTMTVCTIKFSNSFGLWYSVTFLVVGATIPLGILSYCYFHIFKIARSQSSKIAASMLRVANIFQAPITSTPARTITIKGKRAICTILHIVGAFVFTYIPFAVVATTEIIAQKLTNETVSMVAACLVLSAPGVHGAVYGLRNRILRESFVTFVRKKYKQLIERNRQSENGPSRRLAVHCPANWNSSRLRLSVLARRGDEASPRASLYQHTSFISAPASPVLLAVCNGRLTSQHSIRRAHSLPLCSGEFE